MNLTVANQHKHISLSSKTKSEIKKIVAEVLKSEKITNKCQVNFLFTDNRLIKKFNLKYFSRDIPTDVIAFGTKDAGDKIIGDIMISLDMAEVNAKVFKTSFLDELYLYVTHGLLHVLGYQDKTAKQRAMMNKKSDLVLSKLKLNI